jgi:hypothetical protein
LIGTGRFEVANEELVYAVLGLKKEDRVKSRRGKGQEVVLVILVSGTSVMIDCHSDLSKLTGREDDV